MMKLLRIWRPLLSRKFVGLGLQLLQQLLKIVDRLERQILQPAITLLRKRALATFSVLGAAALRNWRRSFV